MHSTRVFRKHRVQKTETVEWKLGWDTELVPHTDGGSGGCEEWGGFRGNVHNDNIRPTAASFHI